MSVRRRHLAHPVGDLRDLQDRVDGWLVERNMGIRSSWVGGELVGLLGSFVRDHGLGWVLPADASYQCFPDSPSTARRPDVSFVRRGRFPGEQLPNGHSHIAPD